MVRPHRALEQLQAQERQKIRDQVRERFARFGDKPCARVLDAAALPHGLQRLLEALGLPPTIKFDQQLELLARFLVEHGPRLFVQRIDALDRKNRSRGDQNYQSDRVDGGENCRELETLILSKDELARTVERMPAPAKPEPAPSAPTPAMPAAPALPEAEPAKPEPPVKILPLAATPPEWFDARGRYIGPERRCGQERRSGDDRRNRIDTISKNTRFGGDRRKTPRRRDDRIRLYAPR